MSGVRHPFIEHHPSARYQLGHPFSQEKIRALQPSADGGLRSGSDHSFTSGLFSRRVVPEPQYVYTAFNRKLHLLYLLQYSLSCHSTYLQVLSAFPKKPLHGQRDLKCLLSVVITTDQEMKIMHLLATHRLNSAWQDLAPCRFLGQQQALEDIHHNTQASILLRLPGTVS